jgi:hypothetical protein
MFKTGKAVRTAGMKAGVKACKQASRHRGGGGQAGRQVGGKQEGRKAGRQEGREAGRQGGRKAGRQEGRKAGRQESRQGGRQVGSKPTGTELDSKTHLQVGVLSDR